MVLIFGSSASRTLHNLLLCGVLALRFHGIYGRLGFSCILMSLSGYLPSPSYGEPKRFRMFLKQIACLHFSAQSPFPLWLLASFALCGCAPEEPAYRSNELHFASLSQESTPQQIIESAHSAQNRLQELFGTPDSPKWPAGIAEAVDLGKVTRAAGPVGRNEAKVERGLYRKHCVQCHGTSGDGMGPVSALLAPYPRDFRRGSFKFKSTPIGKKPTHADLIRTLENGLPGTAMPAFGTLKLSKDFAEDIDALAHYVRFLAIRGEVERRLIAAIVNEENVTELPIQIAAKVADSWVAADSFSLEPPTLRPETTSADQRSSIERGKTVFLSELTACSKCHGIAGDGKGISQDFDDWTKDWTIRAGIDPTKKAEWKHMKKFGALKPVIDSSRNLTLGAFRGGGTREDIYLRIVLGIEGSPMPAIARKVNDNPGITEDGIRDLVEYIYSLSDTEAKHAQTN